MFRSVILSTATLVLAAQAPAPDAASAPKAPAAVVAKAAKSAKTPKAAARKAPVDPVIARIGAEVVRQSEFELFCATTLNDQQRMQLQFMDGALERYRTQFLEFKVLAAKAHKDGLQNRPDHAKKLALMDMQLLIQALMDRDGPALQAKLNVTDAQVKAYFDAHPDKFVTPETFTARHILVRAKGEGDDADADPKALSDADAKAKAEKILAEIKAGKSFTDAAKEYSDDPGSKDKGGLYEDTAFGKFVPEFDKAVRSQKPGTVGDPVKSQFGYHLIQVEKITPAVPQTFDAVKDSAKEQAMAERQEQVMKTYLDGLRKEMAYKEVPPAPAKPEAVAPAKAEAPAAAEAAEAVAPKEAQ
jgi:parvulin-like peptidyl-prolyl isomerase